MFPLRDSHQTQKFPLITIFLIIINVFVFFLEMTSPEIETFISNYALIPSKVDFENYLTWYPFLTSQFLHAGLVHILFNMWFLKIFGDNVEEKFGSTLFFIIYLFTGVVGGLIQYLSAPTSAIPMIGASGAVAGVLGAYFVFFPHHRIETLVPLGLFMTTINVSASFMLFYWFIIQLFSGFGSIAIAQVGGVAFWAHVGGFATGWLIARLYKTTDQQVESGEM